jgi:hypothetical protein
LIGLGAVVGLAILVTLLSQSAPQLPAPLISPQELIANQPAGHATEAGAAKDNPLHFKPLQAGARFAEFPEGDPSRPAQDALNAGDVGRAYNLFYSRDTTRDGPREKRFADVLEAAFKRWSNEDPASDFTDRIKTYWLPQVAALSTQVPTDEQGWQTTITNIEALASSAADAENLTLTPAQKGVTQAFLQRLGAKQSRLYPAYRRFLAEQLRAKLFPENVDLSVSGSDAGTIRLTSPMFANNANIAQVQESARGSLSRARFRKVEYRWSRYIDDGYNYKLNPPADSKVAVWNDVLTTYEEVKLR